MTEHVSIEARLAELEATATITADKTYLLTVRLEGVIQTNGLLQGVIRDQETLFEDALQRQRERCDREIATLRKEFDDARGFTRR